MVLCAVSEGQVGLLRRGAAGRQGALRAGNNRGIARNGQLIGQQRRGNVSTPIFH